MTARFFAILVVSAVLLPAAFAASSGNYLVFFGTYTGRGSQGIYCSRFDGATGKLGPLTLAAEISNPSFLAIHPNHKFLYAVNEVSNFQGQKSGAVSAFAINAASGKLTLLNQESSRGAGPCYVSIDKSGRDALVANYGGGSAAVLPIQPDGRLAPASALIQHTGSSANRKRQAGPHTHSINPSPDDRFAIVADLGLDEVLVYRLDAAKGSLTPNQPPFTKVAPGSGPRHFAFHPNGRFGYVISEMASTVTAFSWDAHTGILRELQTISTLPKEFSGESTCAEIQIHPSGRFLYGSNRGHDSIAVFAVDQRQGTLMLVQHISTQGKTPRNFTIDPAGRYLIAANQDSNNLVVFGINPSNGELTPTGQTLELSRPVCVKFLALQ